MSRKFGPVIPGNFPILYGANNSTSRKLMKMDTEWTSVKKQDEEKGDIVRVM